MQETRLSRRLEAAAGMVRKGKCAADVGCDHGKLCAALVMRGICPYVVATDIHEDPLAKAQGLFWELGIEESTRAVLCDGLAGVRPQEVDDIVIAGVGADTVLHILDDCDWVKDESKRLILVPASHHERVRQGLAERGFAVLREQAVFEADVAYTVMSAAYDGAARTLAPHEAHLGAITAEDADGAAYVAAVQARMQRIAASGAQQEKQSEAQQVLAYIEKELKA